MKSKKFILFCILSYFPFWLYAQNILIKGHTFSADSSANCCVSLFLKDTPYKTRANDEGYFQLMVPLEVFEKSSKMLFLAKIGYTGIEKNLAHLTAEERENLQIYLEEEVFVIDEVKITQAHNLADQFIKEAIANRKKHLNENKPYQAKAYLKGVQKIKTLPEKVLGFKTDAIAKELMLDTNRSGIVYLSESESHIWVDPPKNFKEEVVKSRISGNNRSFSFNRASDLQLNFYENSSHIIADLAPRPFISPISDYAFQYYNFEYLGFSEEGGLTVNKILVKPKRKGEPVYQGVIYLIEGEGRIWAIDVKTDSSLKLQFVNYLQIQQQYFKSSDQVWYAEGAELSFELEFLGIQIEGNYLAVFSDFEILKDLGKLNFNERLKIQSSALLNDSAYWKSFRPIPLSEEEKRDYEVKDSVRVIRDSPEYLDSLDRVFNRFKIGSFFMSGYSHRNRAAHSNWRVDGIFNQVNFNLVEGVLINYGLQYQKILDSLSNQQLRVSGKIRYGFHQKKINPSVALFYNKPGSWSLSLSGGKDMQDFNNRSAYPEWINSVYILAGGRNYFKLYERTFVNTEIALKLPLNSTFKIEASWNKKSFLENKLEYSFLSRQHRRFTSNLPSLIPQENDNLRNHENAGIGFSFHTDFSTDYQNLPSGKRYLKSKFPIVGLYGKSSWSSVNGEFSPILYGGIEVQKEKISLDRWGSFSYFLTFSKFIQKPIYITDFAHIESSNYLFGTMKNSSYLLLDRYSFASNSHQAEAHFLYNFGAIITSKLPVIRNLNLQELVNLHYLSNEKIDHYLELNLGVTAWGFQLLYAKPILIKENKFDLPISKHALRLGVNF